MKLITKSVKLNSDSKVTVSLMNSQIQEMLGLGYELKSHVIDGKGNVIMTYQPSSEKMKYTYSIERVVVSDDVEATITSIERTNERMDRIGYSQKSMFLDGFGNFILTYYKKNEHSRSKFSSSRRTSNRFNRQ